MSDSVIVDIGQAFPNRDERQAMVAWGADYLGDGIGEDKATRIARLSLWYRNTVFANARRRGTKLRFEQCDMLAIGMVVTARRFRAEQSGAGHVRD